MVEYRAHTPEIRVRPPVPLRRSTAMAIIVCDTVYMEHRLCALDLPVWLNGKTVVICEHSKCDREVEQGKRGPRTTKRFCSYRCKNRAAVLNRRRRLKELAIAHKGGRCSVCGYNKSSWALVFHHKEPAKKSFGLSARGITRAWSKVLKELDKCVLLCANCHFEQHNEEFSRLG